MKAKAFWLLAAFALTSGTANVALAAPTPVTIDFSVLNYNNLASLNALLAPYGISVDAGLPGSVSGGLTIPLSAGTYAPAADLLFNFTNAVSSVSFATVNFSGSAVGATGYDVLTTATGALALQGTGDQIAYQGETEGNVLTLTQAGIKSVQLEDNGSTIGVQSITFTTQPVPEPATFGLLALGAIGLAGMRSRRQVK